MKQVPIEHRLTPRQRVIYDMLQKQEGDTNREFVKQCSRKFGSISRVTIVRDMNDLVRMGYVVRSGRGRSMIYRAQKQPSGREKSRMRSIPPFLKKYFWDTDMAKLSLTKHATYIIERILEFGDREAVTWLRKVFPERMIVSVLGSSRRISDRSWNFWKLIFSHHNFVSSCTRRFSKKTQEKIWNY